MPGAPQIFLSVTGADLQSARGAVHHFLLSLGCIPVIAEHREPDSATFCTAVRERIEQCHAVVHIVGRAYGHEPQQRQPGEPRRSYGQLEYDLAILLRKPLRVFLCTDDFPFDPYPAEEAEKARLQQVHRDFVQGGGRASHAIQSLNDLEAQLRASPLLPMPARPPPVSRTRVPVLLIALVMLGIGALAAAVVGWRAWSGRQRTAVHAIRSDPAPVPTMIPDAVASTPAPAAAEPGPAAAEPPPMAVADDHPVTDATRSQILARIDRLPDIPASKKDKLYEAVRHAQDMRRLLVLPFATASSRLSPADERRLNELLQTREMSAFREDLTCIFVLLGFADVRGGKAYNLELSTERTRTVRELMVGSGGIKNVIHPVGMGSTTLLDEQQLAKNRIVEIWGVRP